MKCLLICLYRFFSVPLVASVIFDASDFHVQVQTGNTTEGQVEETRYIVYSSPHAAKVFLFNSE